MTVGVDLPIGADLSLAVPVFAGNWSTTMKLNVEGLTCGHCETSITRVVAALSGTSRVDLDAGTVDIDGLDGAENVARVCAAIEGEDYRVVARESDAAADLANEKAWLRVVARR